ncbi:HEXXH motif-containing putative peptide modification protein [Streptomyces poriferorum]|uniref:aKG-HExxH-type peptide beta-hydroxylase n=1 Tax=Streptomyces poriferorum TaxID=2798799 RepID=UPI00273D392E|nr:HEXXH motif-containing putative peptide modification protein [Streptomyces sp. Alt1]WLQ51660.1 HEXXH motif-containing putative peptide modification protein [Streptomyces sp. Alt1]
MTEQLTGVAPGRAALLAAHPDFGRADAIGRRARQVLGFTLAAALRRFGHGDDVAVGPEVAGDPAVWAALQSMFDGLHEPVTEPSSVLAAAIAPRAPRRDGLSPTGSEPARSCTARIGERRQQTVWLWQGVHGPLTAAVDAAFGRYARTAPASRETHSHALGAGNGDFKVSTLYAAGEIERKAVETATELLCAAVPEITRETFPFIDGITFFDGDLFASGTLLSQPGIIFIERRIIDDPDRLAEALLHEALHLKLNALTLTRPVHRAGVADDSALLLPVPWHRDAASGAPHRWLANRALAAAHVYVHLVALYERHAPSARSRATGPDVCRERAAYLLTELLADASRDLGPAGVRMARWLRDVLAAAPRDHEGGAAVPGPGPRREREPGPLSRPGSTAGLPAGTLRRSAPGHRAWRPEPDLCLVATFEPWDVHVLNAYQWAFFTACDGVDSGLAVSSLRAAAPGSAATAVTRALTDLLDTGLMVIEQPPGTQSAGDARNERGR